MGKHINNIIVSALGFAGAYLIYEQIITGEKSPEKIMYAVALILFCAIFFRSGYDGKNNKD